MFERGRYPSAAGLAILSIEESGKLRVLRDLALIKNEEELLAVWRDYRQHTRKNQHWLLVDGMIRGASRLRDFLHLFDSQADHPQILDQLKQLSFYTDCLANRHWSAPDKVIDQDLAKGLVQVAEIVCNARDITTEEIDLWSLHMKPVYKTTIEAMERALIAWDREMRSRGLVSSGLTMEEFVTRGVHGSSPSDEPTT